MSLATVRAALAADLSTATGLTVHPSVPNVMTPPCLVLRPDNPWVTTGDVYMSWQVSYVLTIFVEYGEFDTVTAAIERALPSALAGLGEWGVTQIGEPYVAAIGETNIPGVDINVALYVSDL